MPRNWDQTLKDWAETIHATDEARGKRAKQIITEAVHDATSLAKKKIDVYVTGSYRNNTNIRADSDIDVAVVACDVIFYQLPGKGSPTKEDLGIRDPEYAFPAFRDEVGEALRAKLKKENVAEGDKAFKIFASGDRLKADVPVFFGYRLYTGGKNEDGSWHYHEGIAMNPRSDPSKRIVNWPKQHVMCGEAKNTKTNGRFKRLVRIFKHLRADMAEQGNAEQKSGAGQVTSFFLECLISNAPNSAFDQDDGGWLGDMREVLTYLGKATKPDADASAFTEVSGREQLFRAETGRTQAQAYAFVRAAWGRVFEGEKFPW